MIGDFAQVALCCALVTGAAVLLERWMGLVHSDGFGGRLRPRAAIDAAICRLCGADPEAEQNWVGYAAAVLAFNLAGWLVLSPCRGGRPVRSSPSARRIRRIPVAATLFRPPASIGASLSRLDEGLLTGLPPYTKLTPPQIREILDLSLPRRYPEGQPVFREGEAVERFHMPLDGCVRVVRTTKAGKQLIALHIPPGELFGIAPAIRRKTYPAIAICASESLALSWPSRLWPDFMARHDGFSTATYRTIGERLGEIQARVTDLASKAVKQRVAAALPRLVSQSRRKLNDGIEIAFPITWSNISEMTETTLHTLDRRLSAWQRDCVVGSSRKHIKATKPHQLLLLSGAAGD